MSAKKRAKPLPQELDLSPVGVDSHAHLDFPQFEPDLEEVLERARQSGLRFLVNVFLGPEAYQTGRALFHGHPEVFFVLGKHPHEAEAVSDEVVARMEACFEEDPRLRALGEIGLDLYRHRAPEQAQLRAFEAQLRLARERDWPVVIHSREAARLTLDTLCRSGFQDRPLLWHCFAGDEALAREVVGAGWHVSIPGTVTYRKAEAMLRAVRELPMSRLLLETDCPFLSPEPYRGSRNEPAYTVFTAQAVAEAKGLALEDVWRQAAENAVRFFGLEQAAG